MSVSECKQYLTAASLQLPVSRDIKDMGENDLMCS